MAVVKGVQDINDKTLTDIFAAFYADRSVTARAKGDYGRLSGINDNYNSDIKKLTVVVSREGKGEDEANVVVKLPVTAPFLRKMHKGC